MKLIWKSGIELERPLGHKLTGMCINKLRPSSVELSARELQLLAAQLNSDLISVRDNAARYMKHLSQAIFHYE